MGIAALAFGAGMAALAPVGAAHAASAYTLLVLPDAGESQIYSFIDSATSSIDMTMYELRDTTVENDLIASEKAGVKVRVILDRQQTSVNGAAYSALQAGGVSVTYSSASRDYGVFDTNASDVSAIEAVFAADFAKTSITPSGGADLVWSPTDSQSQILALIKAPSTPSTSRRRSSRLESAARFSGYIGRGFAAYAVKGYRADADDALRLNAGRVGHFSRGFFPTAYVVGRSMPWPPWSLLASPRRSGSGPDLLVDRR